MYVLRKMALALGQSLREIVIVFLWQPYAEVCMAPSCSIYTRGGDCSKVLALLYKSPLFPTLRSSLTDF